MATSPCDGPEENAFAAQAGAALVPKERGPDLIAPVKVPDVGANSFTVKILKIRWQRFGSCAPCFPGLFVKLFGQVNQALRGIYRLVQIATLTAINVELKISIIEFDPKAQSFRCIEGWHLDQANLEHPNSRNRGGA